MDATVQCVITVFQKTVLRPFQKVRDVEVS